MKQTIDSSLRKKYVPYGINGEYFVYDNEAGQIPMGYGTGKSKKAIQAICDKLNAENKDYDNKWTGSVTSCRY